jgi:hypothetical protein
MLTLLRQPFALALSAIAFSLVSAGAQTLPAASPAANADVIVPSKGPAQFTGKERLGEKWRDGQRIDNCKVPVDKRETKPRPDACAHAPAD